MKTKFGREMALLSVPVLFIGGVALWQSRLPAARKSGAKPAKIGGPPRILMPSWKRIPVSPYLVADGYDFVVETRPEIIERADLPIGVRQINTNLATLEKSQLMFRRNKKWVVVKPRADKALIANEIRSGFDKNAPNANDLRLRIRLEDVPRDAQEIRLRGRLESSASYAGTWPSTLKKPATVHSNKWGLNESRISPPFEITIKGPTEPFPAPQVSRQEPVAIVEARFSRAFGNFELQLWVKRQQWAIARNPQHKLSVWGAKLFDGNGREIDIYDSSGTNQGNAAQRSWTSYLHRAVGPQLTDNEELLHSLITNEAPRGGWKNIKLPLRLEAKISDDDSWPAQFKGTLREVKSYEAPKTRGN